MVSTSLLTPRPVPGQFIAISQVGGPTLWVRSATGAPAPPATSATRYSTAGYYSAPTTNYKPADLVAFVGNLNVGTFSQQVAIIVDSVKSVTIGATTYNGVIDKWHFLWGGLYDPANLPTSMHGVTIDGTMVQDPDHSHLANSSATGAVLTPAWAGWALLNNQVIASGGVGYSLGDTITLSQGTSDGSTVNQGHYPKLVVEAVSGTAVTSFDWLDYGSYFKLPNMPTVLTSAVTSGAGMSFSIGTSADPVQWTRGPLATQIDYVVDEPGGLLTDIFVTEAFTANPPPPYNAFPTTMPVQFFYYGHDDGLRISNALASQSANSIATGNGAAFRLPGACGTTVPITLPQDAKANFVNPALVGANFQSTGLYAFAPALSSRGPSTPVLNRVLYAGLANASGGGFRDMTIEAMGIPEGFGYWRLAEGAGASPCVSAPIGYIGPPPLTCGSPPGPLQTPTAGDAVEIDSGKYLRIRNVHIRDGGIGSGNSVFHCGIDEADPTGVLGANAVGNLVVSNSRLDANPLISGATDSDIVLRLGNNCHDSVYTGLILADGTRAGLLDYNGNMFSQIEITSDAVVNNAPAATGLVLTAANSGFAGVADYGVYSIQNTSFAQAQCDIANLACILMAADNVDAYHNPGQITDTQMRCGVLPSAPPAYLGVELGAGAANITVGGTTAIGTCHVPPVQLVAVDAPLDGSVSLCDNANTSVVFCGGGVLAPGRYYTQPSLGYTSGGVTLSGAASGPTTLYAIPFINPAGGSITQLGLYVTSPGVAGTSCELGVYGSAAGVPGPLLLDGGPVAVTSATAQTLTGLNLVLRPSSLYFLAVGCNGAVSVQGTTGASTNGFAALWLGEPDLITYGATNVIGTWSPGFSAHGLPASFGAVTLPRPSTDVPNIYVGR